MNQARRPTQIVRPRNAQRSGDAGFERRVTLNESDRPSKVGFPLQWCQQIGPPDLTVTLPFGVFQSSRGGGPDEQIRLVAGGVADAIHGLGDFI
jgi:hypothetical protein